MACTASAFGQVAAAQLTGAVHDPAGAAVPGTSVTVTDVDRGASRTVVSGSAGEYSFAGLSPGLYRIVAERSGFRRLVREGVRCETGRTIRLDLALAVGEVTESVTVTGGAPLLRTATGLGQSVSAQQVLALPLNGRSFITLASLAAGVALPPGSPFPRINGGRPRTNEYLFDGISVLQPEPGQVAFLPVIDAIEDFRIETNSPPAEFSRFNGGVVNLATKAGINAFHGRSLTRRRRWRMPRAA